MRTLLWTTAILTAAITPAGADDGRIPHETLSAIGLGGMRVLSDEAGLEVRGMSSSAAASGRSLGVAQLIDPATNSFLTTSDTNAAGASAENAGLNSVSMVSFSQGSFGDGTLDVTQPTSNFSGAFFFTIVVDQQFNAFASAF